MHLPHIEPFAKHPIYFLTACTADRRRVLSNTVAVGILRNLWNGARDLDGWSVGRYVVMPDHVHFFARPAPEAKPRTAWLKMLKSTSARRICAGLGIPPPLWQPDTFDHILRDSRSYSQKWDYVYENPVRAGLVDRPEKWPWSGEIESLTF